MSRSNEFHVGVLDLFGILLPGAIAIVLLATSLGGLKIKEVVPPPETSASFWIGFLICAYAFGHLIFQTGAFLDPIYDILREKLSRCGNEDAYRCATQIRDQFLAEAKERRAVNTFQWSRAVLLEFNPAAAEDVARLEADSKFFRSLIVVCILTMGFFFGKESSVAGTWALSLIVPCFACYYGRRLKSNTQAYIHIITLYRLGRIPAAKLVEPELVSPG